tara:strand:- start:287 stop:1438 length:1152 start_codon:yes stop_codon:yes gene_type:complete
MAKPTYTKPIPLENLPYTPKEVGKLRELYKANNNKTTELDNVNIKGLGSGKLIMSKQYGTRFFPDSNKEFHQRTMRNLNIAQLGFNAPMILAPFIGAAKGVNKIGNQKGWFSGRGNTRSYPFGNEGNVVNLTNKTASNNLQRLGSNVTGTLKVPNDKAVRFTPAELKAMGINQPMASTLKVNPEEQLGQTNFTQKLSKDMEEVVRTTQERAKLIENLKSKGLKTQASIDKYVANKKWLRDTLYADTFVTFGDTELVYDPAKGVWNLDVATSDMFKGNPHAQAWFAQNYPGKDLSKMGKGELARASLKYVPVFLNEVPPPNSTIILKGSTISTETAPKLGIKTTGDKKKGLYQRLWGNLPGFSTLPDGSLSFTKPASNDLKIMK